jgi:hypothetical protein
MRPEQDLAFWTHPGLYWSESTLQNDQLCGLTTAIGWISWIEVGLTGNRMNALTNSHTIELILPAVSLMRSTVSLELPNPSDLLSLARSFSGCWLVGGQQRVNAQIGRSQISSARPVPCFHLTQEAHKYADPIE